MNSSRIALDVTDDLLDLGTDDQNNSDDSNEADGRDEDEANDARHEAASRHFYFSCSCATHPKMRNSQSLEKHGERRWSDQRWYVY